MKIVENNPLPDSTTTFLTPKELLQASVEAAEAVATLQVSTDTAEMEQFSDLFNVSSCSEPFTLIDHFGQHPPPQMASNGLENTKMTSLKPAEYELLQSTSSNSTLGTAVLTNTNSDVMVTSTTLDQPLIEVTNSRGQKNVVVSSMVNNDVYTLTLTDGSVVQLRVQSEHSPAHPHQHQASVVQIPQTEDITDLDNVSQTWLPSHDSNTISGNGNRCSTSGVSPAASFSEEVTLPFTAGNSASTPPIGELYEIFVRKRALVKYQFQSEVVIKAMLYCR